MYRPKMGTVKARKLGVWSKIFFFSKMVRDNKNRSGVICLVMLGVGQVGHSLCFNYYLYDVRVYQLQLIILPSSIGTTNIATAVAIFRSPSPRTESTWTPEPWCWTSTRRTTTISPPASRNKLSARKEKKIQSFRFFLKFIQGFVTCLLALAFRSAAVVCKTL